MRHFKKPNTLLSELLPSIVASAVFASIVGLMVACGGSNPITSPLPGAGTQSVVVTSHIGPSMRAFPASKGVQIASFLNFFQAAPSATLSQSFEGTCTFSNNPGGPNPSLVGAHGEYGNTGFVALNIPNFDHSCGDISVTGVNPVALPSIGAGDTTTLRGWPIFTSGTVSVVVAAVLTRNGKQTFCRDTTSSQAETDGATVLPYLRLDDNTVVLGSSTTTLANHCQITLDAGDDISTITVSAAKE